MKHYRNVDIWIRASSMPPSLHDKWYLPDISKLLFSCLNKMIWLRPAWMLKKSPLCVKVNVLKIAQISIFAQLLSINRKEIFNFAEKNRLNFSLRYFPWNLYRSPLAWFRASWEVVKRLLHLFWLFVLNENTNFSMKIWNRNVFRSLFHLRRERKRERIKIPIKMQRACVTRIILLSGEIFSIEHSSSCCPGVKRKTTEKEFGSSPGLCDVMQQVQ